MPIDYKRYPPSWGTEIVPYIIARAGNMCECCGLENKSEVYAVKFCLKDKGKYQERSLWFRVKNDAEREARAYGVGEIKAVKVILTVAHLDHDETNHEVSLDRLKAMCQLCHLRYDAKEKYRREQEKWRR